MRALVAVLTLSLGVAACDGAEVARDVVPAERANPVATVRRERTSPAAPEPATSAVAAPTGPSPAKPSSSRGHVVGRILDESGDVPPGAALRLPRITGRRSGYDCISPTTPVDAAGRFDWHDPNALGYVVGPDERRLVRLVADAKGCVPWVGPWIEAGEELVDVGTIRLRRGESIAGTLCDVEGAPLAGVDVELAPDADVISEDWYAVHSGGLLWGRPPGAAAGAWPQTTAHDGTFSFDGLSPGRYRLRCARPGSPPPVVVATETRDARIVLPPALCPRRVAVDVVAFDDSGRRLDEFGVFLRCDESSKSADAHDGVAHVEITTWGPAQLRVDRDDADQHVEAGDVETRGEPYVVTFPAFHEIRGTVLFDGRPLRWRDGAPEGERSVHVWVTATPNSSSDGRWLRHEPPSTTTAPDGTFALRVPYAGRWALSVSDCAERAAPVTGVGAAEAGATDAVVAVHRIADFDVRVLPPEGARLEDFRGSLVDPSSTVRPFFRADKEDDRLRFIEAAVGRPLVLHVRGTCGGERTLVATLDVRADGGPYEIRLACGLAIDGVVVRRDGTPAVNCDVRCAPSRNAADDDCEDATSGVDGRFHVVGLAPGTWFLTAASGVLESVASVEATAGSRDVRLVAVPRKSPF